MQSNANRAPGFRRQPDYPLTIEPVSGRVWVEFAGRIVAETRAALCLREARLAPVWYLPREDVRTELMLPSEHTSYCPYKGEASYWHLRVDERRSVNAVWSYEAPYDEVAAIAGYLAFYPARVDAVRGPAG